jgi:DNA-binding NtrC family response regulator
LRERAGDIPLLAQNFLREFARENEKKVNDFSAEALEAMMEYRWPGNVRELRNTMERGVIVCDSSLLDQRHLPPNFGSVGVRVPASEGEGLRLEVGTTVGEAEKMLILKTLAANNNNKTRAAEVLGISLKTLHNKLKEYGSATAVASEGAN